jgi:hypothetical protein
MSSNISACCFELLSMQQRFFIGLFYASFYDGLARL